MHVRLTEEGTGYEVTDLVRADTVTEVLEYVAFEPQALVKTFRRKVAQTTGLTRQERNGFIAHFVEGLDRGTYLEPAAVPPAGSPESNKDDSRFGA